jgi:hypothetical protein
MATLTKLVTSIQDILQDTAYTDQVIIDRINEELQKIAAGVRMPNGDISPCLPDLHAYGTVNTSTSLPYVALPANYQRNVIAVYDSSMYQIEAPRGGNYYAFSKFLSQIANMGLAETGEIYRVACKGTKIYYQGIPSSSTTLGVHYYRKPLTLALDGDIPEGIPDHLQGPLLKHKVCAEIMGERIEDGQDNSGVGVKYHNGKFYQTLTDLVDFVGVDVSPQYYGDGSSEDRGACDG